MKTFLTILFFVFAGVASAQSARATASATIVNPITTEIHSNVEFKSAANKEGKILIQESGVLSYDKVGKLLENIKSNQTASIKITNNNHSFSVLMDTARIWVARTGSSETLSVDPFKFIVPLSGDAQSYTMVSIGATIFMQPAQPAGSYTDYSNLLIVVSFE